MSYVEKKLEDLRSEKGLSVNKMGSLLGISGSGYHAMIKNESTKVSILEKACEKFDIEMSYFFDGAALPVKKSVSDKEEAYWQGRYEELRAAYEKLEHSYNFVQRQLDRAMDFIVGGKRRADPDLGKPNSGNVQGLTLNSHYQRCARESSRVFAVTA